MSSFKFNRSMKPAIIATLLMILVGYASTALSQDSIPGSRSHFSVDAYEQISSGMTRDEVRGRLGAPASIQAKRLPEGHFFGPQEGIDVNALDSLRRYEEWEYEHGDTVYLIWFGDEAREERDWRTIGKISYPRGAVF